MVRTQLDADLRDAITGAIQDAGAPPLSPQYQRYLDAAVTGVQQTVNTFLDEVVEDLVVSAQQLGASPEQIEAALDAITHDDWSPSDENGDDEEYGSELADLRRRVERLEGIARSARLM